MMCPRLDSLLKASSGNVDSSVEGHLESCLQCQSELEIAEKTLDQWNGGKSRGHLTNNEVIELAEYSGSPVSDQQRELWRHAAHCRECLGYVARMRHVSDESTGSAGPPVSVSFRQIWNEYNARTSKRAELVMAWVGVGAGIAATLLCKSHVRLNRLPPSRHKGASEDTNAFVANFGLYELEIKIAASKSEPEFWKLEARLKHSTGRPESGVKLCLLKDDEELAMLTFRGESIQLPSQPTGEYLIKLLNRDGSAEGEIAIQVGG
jgi:hypothetical protein